MGDPRIVLVGLKSGWVEEMGEPERFVCEVWGEGDLEKLTFDRLGCSTMLELSMEEVPSNLFFFSNSIFSNLSRSESV